MFDVVGVRAASCAHKPCLGWVPFLRLGIVMGPSCSDMLHAFEEMMPVVVRISGELLARERRRRCWTNTLPAARGLRV